ncbi:MAG: DUF1566 domain-containing protein [Exilibacterium sp.]
MRWIRRRGACRCSLLFVIFVCYSCIIWGCNNQSHPATSNSSQTGSLRFELNLQQTLVDTNAEPAAVDCGAANVDTITLILYESDQKELDRGGPWNCGSHEGKVTGIKPAAGCTAVILAADPQGVANYRAIVNDIAIIDGQETNLGMVEIQPYTINADAGSDQYVLVGTEVSLDASGSYADPAAPLLYHWEIISAPLGSSARLTSPNAIAPKFVVDIEGSYTCSLFVSDDYSSSVIDQVSVHAGLQAGQPVANAGDDFDVVLGQAASLDGSASSDPENDSLSFNWEITTRPAGSLTQLNNPTAVNPTFNPDQVGKYTIQLIVNDGQYDSVPDDVVVAVVNTPPEATILEPRNSSIVYLSDPVFLSGSATDSQDGALPGSSLTWSSNIDGPLGSGKSLELTDLSLGVHTLTLTARDTHGEEDQVTVNVEVYYQRVVDTGQTQSFTDTAGEDSDYLINPFSYVDNGNGTVSDNNTGLMWEQTAGISGGYSVAEAENYCENLSLSGHSDWRLPSRKELVSIISYWNLDPSINRNYFGTYSGSYFSTDRCEDLGGRAVVGFVYGLVSCDPDFDNHQVRCVRSGINPPFAWTEGLVDNGNGTITDQLTGLMWQQEEFGRPAQGSVCEEIVGYIDHVPWETALTYCQDLQLGGYSNWRLPNIKELESITDERGLQTSFNTTFFPHACGNYWSSTSFIVDSGYAYYYENQTGQFKFTSKNDTLEVKCVRGGQ